MSCGVGVNGTFAPLNATWSQSSSLRMNDWDPYPELLPQNGCYGQLNEGYCGGGCSNNACASYNTDVAAIQQRPGPNLTRSVSIPPVRMRENFGSSQCCMFTKAPGAKYQNLGLSWAVQQMYTT